MNASNGFFRHATWIISLAAAICVGSICALWRRDDSAAANVLEQRLLALDETMREMRDEVERWTIAVDSQTHATAEAFERSDENVRRSVESLRGELAARFAALRDSSSAAPAMTPVTEPEPAVVAREPEPAVVAPSADRPVEGGGHRFLAFRLPSSGFAFDAPRRFVLSSDLSRVGFDAKSTLHDFSGTTSSVRGELATCLARPQESCTGRIVVSALGLTTGEPDRDANMRETLAAADHPELTFEIVGFRARSVDPLAQTLEGDALGRMEVRGVLHDVSMPVRASVDPSKRLVVEGETRIHLPDFGVPVPSKFGLIRMEPDVRVWISLRFRAVAPTESARGSEVADAR